MYIVLYLSHIIIIIILCSAIMIKVVHLYHSPAVHFACNTCYYLPVHNITENTLPKHILLKTCTCSGRLE